MERLAARRGLVCLLGLLANCGGDPAPRTGGNSAADAGAGAAGDGVTIVQVDRFGFLNGTITEAKTHRVQFTSASAIATVDGAEKTFPGTLQADGSAVIPNVPNGAYVVELRSEAPGAPTSITHYPIDGERTVRFGANYWRRPNPVAMVPSTKLALTVKTPVPFKALDAYPDYALKFAWIGRGSQFLRTLEWPESTPGVSFEVAVQNPPELDATSTKDWTVISPAVVAPHGEEGSGLPNAGDDLTLTESQVTLVAGHSGDALNPWDAFVTEAVVGVLEVSSPAFANGITNVIEGDLVAPPSETLTIDFQGSSYSRIRADAKYPKNTQSSVTISMTQEVGPGPEYFIAVTPQCWSLRTASLPKAVAADGWTDPGDLLAYSFRAPSVYASGMREVYSVTYNYTLEWRAPDGGLTSFAAAATSYRAKTSSHANLALELGSVRNLRFGGVELSWENANSVPETAPLTITFDPPNVGTPEHYVVNVYDLNGSSSATYVTRATSLTLPSGTLLPKHAYYVQVAAVRDGTNFAEPLVHHADIVRTEAFFPPFTFGN